MSFLRVCLALPQRWGRERDRDQGKAWAAGALLPPLCQEERGRAEQIGVFWFNNLPFPRNCKKFQSCGKIRLFLPFKHLQRDTRRHLSRPLASAVTRAMEGGSPRGEPPIHCCSTPSPPPRTPEAEKGDVNPLRGGSGGGWRSPTAPREGRGATPPRRSLIALWLLLLYVGSLAC